MKTLDILLALALAAIVMPTALAKKTREAQDDASPVIVTINGKPLITKKKLQQVIDDLIEMQPQYKAMLQKMSRKQLERNIIEGLAKQAIIDHYVLVNNLANAAGYKARLARVMEMATQMVNAEMFTENMKVHVSDREVKEFYDRNKDVMPQLLLAPGGVNAVAVEFDSEPDALIFLAKAKTDFGGDLKKAADRLGKSNRVWDFKLVNSATAGIDPVLRQKIASYSTFPTTELVKVSEYKVWVVMATGKEDAKYRPFAELKADLKAFLEKEKLQERINEEISKLHKAYEVEVNKDYLKD